MEAVVDPLTNALACASGMPRVKQSEAVRRERDRLVDRARKHGPAALLPRQKLLLLNDPMALSRLHVDVWTRPDTHVVWRGAAASPCNVIQMRAAGAPGMRRERRLAARRAHFPGPDTSRSDPALRE